PGQDPVLPCPARDGRGNLATPFGLVGLPRLRAPPPRRPASTRRDYIRDQAWDQPEADRAAARLYHGGERSRLQCGDGRRQGRQALDVRVMTAQGMAARRAET